MECGAPEPPEDVGSRGEDTAVSEVTVLLGADAERPGLQDGPGLPLCPRQAWREASEGARWFENLRGRFVSAGGGWCPGRAFSSMPEAMEG